MEHLFILAQHIFVIGLSKGKSHNIRFGLKGKWIAQGKKSDLEETAVNCVMGQLRWNTATIPGILLSKSCLCYLHFEGQYMNLHVCVKYLANA